MQEYKQLNILSVFFNFLFYGLLFVFVGVRALLIDKDQNPKWDPPSLPQVTQAIVEKHFAVLPEEQELKNKL